MGLKHTEIRLKMLGSTLDCGQGKSIDNSETQFSPLLNEGDNDPEMCMCAQLWKHLTWCPEQTGYSVNVSFMYHKEWELRNAFPVGQSVWIFITCIQITMRHNLPILS